MATLRPMIHSPLARTLYERLLRDHDLEQLDKTKWYSINQEQMTDDFLRQSFVQCDLDADTQEFLDQSAEKSSWLGAQICYAVARLFLGWFLTQTTLNGLLGRGSMFVFSMSQFLRLMRIEGDPPSLPLFGSLLDVGAGDGNVTAAIAPLFGRVDVTEKSPSMRRVLSRRGFRVLDAVTLRPDDAEDGGESQLYDVICCLNVLDRCETPLGLLRMLRARLAHRSGRLVLALVLPLSQYVESGKCGTKPLEKLRVRGSTLEQQVQSLYKDVIVPAGFILETWTRLPYFCEGDLEQAYYWLDDVVMVLRAADPHGYGPS